MYAKIITLNGTEYKLTSDIPISIEMEKLAIQKLEIQKLTATCPSTSKTVGQTVTLNCTATAGIPPFTMTFKKGGVVLATRTVATVNTPVTPVTDVVTAVGSVVYSVDCVDSCTTPDPSSVTETCTVNVIATCVPLQATFSVT